jgi:hypothetical protein
MIKRTTILFFLSLLFFNQLLSQIQFGIGKNQEFIDAYERFLMIYDSSKSALNLQYYDPILFNNFLNSINSGSLSRKDKWDYELLENEMSPLQIGSVGNKEAIFFKKGRIFSFKDGDITLALDPLIYFAFGNDTESEKTPFRNTRGINLIGQIDQKLFFRTSILENQASYLAHIERRISQRNAIPGQGFFKRYQSNLLDNISGWDFLNAEGVLTFRPSDHFNASIGHGSFFLGSGYHSLLLSDYADNFFFVELNTSFGRFKYKNIFAELAPVGSTIEQVGDLLAPKKYLATHYLSIALSRRLEISLFESVIFGRENHFEFQYLNPLILYRVVEQKLDSPDNVMIGLNINYRLNAQNIFYSQFLVDEMKVGELFSGNGWWGNKLGFQIGFKHFNLMSVDHLDIQLEFNSVRPFTYSHRLTEGLDYTVASYSHYNQELAHPLGANFNEILFLWKYRLSKKWSVNGRVFFAQIGKSISENIGQDILRPSNSRISDFENSIGKGESTKILQLGTILTYHLPFDYYADFQFLYRNEESDYGNFNVKSTYFGISFRAHLSHQKLDY